MGQRDNIFSRSRESLGGDHSNQSLWKAVGFFQHHSDSLKTTTCQHINHSTPLQVRKLQLSIFASISKSKPQKMVQSTIPNSDNDLKRHNRRNT